MTTRLLLPLAALVVAGASHASGEPAPAVRVENAPDAVFAGRNFIIALVLGGRPGGTAHLQATLFQTAGALAAPLTVEQAVVRLDAAGRARADFKLSAPPIRALTECLVQISTVPAPGRSPATLATHRLTVVPTALWSAAARTWGGRSLVIAGDPGPLPAILRAQQVPFETLSTLPAQPQPERLYVAVRPWDANSLRSLEQPAPAATLLIFTGVESPVGWLTFESHDSSRRAVITVKDLASLGEAGTQLTITHALHALTAPQDNPRSPLPEMLPTVLQP